MKKQSALSVQHSAKGLFLLAVCASVFCVSLLARASALDGNNPEQELRAKYQGQVVMLRNFYCGKELQFDAQGNLTNNARPGAWTLCRDVKVEELKSWITSSGFPDIGFTCATTKAKSSFVM